MISEFNEHIFNVVLSIFIGLMIVLIIYSIMTPQKTVEIDMTNKK
jgi:hypothetical protein